MKQLSSQRGYL